MHSKEQLIDQHIREYESRQKHMDELLQGTEKHTENNPEPQANQADPRQRQINKWATHEIKDAGPMGIWYGLISELETLIERIGK